VSGRLRNLAIARHGGWIAAVVHIKKVKSFAPHVNHYVADVLVGPPTQFTIPVGSRLDRIDPGLALVVLCHFQRRNPPSSMDAKLTQAGLMVQYKAKSERR
jgi:hypothetical protein